MTNLLTLLGLLLQYTDEMRRLGAVINGAIKEGRDVTDSEIDAFRQRRVFLKDEWDKGEDE